MPSTLFMTSSIVNPCRLDRRPDEQGSRHPVSSQAGLEKFATGCDGLSPSTYNGTRSPPTKRNPKKMKNIRVATINVRTCQGDLKLVEVIKAASQLNLDVLAMQETRRISSGVITLKDDSINGWQLIWSGHKRKRQHGVAILLAPHVILEDHNVFQDARIITAKVRSRGVRFALLNAYAPTEASGSENAKSCFYSSLNKAKQYLDKMPKFKLIALGDFNATISAHSKTSGAWDSVLGHNNSDRVETNNNGERLLTWCSKSKLKIVNSIFRTKRIHRGTWQHAATGKWKRLDYVCTTSWLMKFVRSCRVYIGPSRMFDSDHRLLVLDMEFPDATHGIQAELIKGRSEPRRLRRDLNVLRDCDEKRMELTARLEDNLGHLNGSDMNVDLFNDEIVNAVRRSTEEVCPVIDDVKKKEPWNDEVLDDIRAKLKSCKEGDVKHYKKMMKDRNKWLKNQY